MSLIYVLTKIFTFPGALTKALFEQIMCRILKCPVEDNRYLRTNEMCGHVDHELIERPVASFMYCFIPGMLNFFLGMMLVIFPAINVFALGNYTGFIASTGLASYITNASLVTFLDTLLPFVVLWLAASMFINIFPLYEDALVMKEQYSKLNAFCKIIFFPGYIVMRVGTVLEKYGITFLFWLAVSIYATIA